jgi:hypothetical protein
LAHSSILMRQHPASVMVWGCVMDDGRKLPLSFVDMGVKINRWVYKDMLQEHVVPWLQKTYGNNPYTFQQDGAPFMFSSTGNLCFHLFGTSQCGRPPALISIRWTSQCDPSLRTGSVGSPTKVLAPWRLHFLQNGTEFPRIWSIPAVLQSPSVWRK